MADLKIHKVVAALPTPLEPNAVYAVRAGSGFDLYIADSTGSMAHLVNAGDVSGFATQLQTLQDQQDALAGSLIDYDDWLTEHDQRLRMAALHGSPNGSLIPGFHHDASLGGGATVNGSAGFANRLELSPYTPQRPFLCEQILVWVVTAAADQFGRVVVYSSSWDGKPENLIYSSADFSFATTGSKAEWVNLLFEAETQYWLGVHQTGGGALLSIPVASARNLGLTSSGSSGSAPCITTCRAGGHVFANGAPSRLTSVTWHNSTPISVRMLPAEVY